MFAALLWLAASIGLTLTEVGIQNPASNFQTKKEGWGKLGRKQVEDVTNKSSLMEENGPADDGREEKRKHLENHGLGHLRQEVPVMELRHGGATKALGA